MIVVTVDFPDERAGIRHLHSTFTDQDAARLWIDFIQEAFGRMNTQTEERTLTWTCPDCLWTTRGGRKPRSSWNI